MEDTVRDVVEYEKLVKESRSVSIMKWRKEKVTKVLSFVRSFSETLASFDQMQKKKLDKLLKNSKTELRFSSLKSAKYSILRALVRNPSLSPPLLKLIISRITTLNRSDREFGDTLRDILCSRAGSAVELCLSLRICNEPSDTRDYWVVSSYGNLLLEELKRPNSSSITRLLDKASILQSNSNDHREVNQSVSVLNMMLSGLINAQKSSFDDSMCAHTLEKILESSSSTTISRLNPELIAKVCHCEFALKSKKQLLLLDTFLSAIIHCILQQTESTFNVTAVSQQIEALSSLLEALFHQNKLMNLSSPLLHVRSLHLQLLESAANIFNRLVQAIEKHYLFQIKLRDASEESKQLRTNLNHLLITLRHFNHFVSSQQRTANS